MKWESIKHKKQENKSAKSEGRNITEERREMHEERRNAGTKKSIIEEKGLIKKKQASRNQK